MGKVLFIGLGTLLSLAQAWAQDGALARYQRYLKDAVAAERRGEYVPALKNYLEMLGLVPDKPEAHYGVARVQARMGNAGEALASLEKALSLGYVPAGGLGPAFESFKGSDGFRKILALMDELSRPIGRSRTAFTIPEKDLLPEGIAYDPKERSFYLGSMWKCKIVKIDRRGKVLDFIGEKQDGLRSVAGLKVDSARGILWAVSFMAMPWARSAPEEVGWSAVFKYDLRTGKLLNKYELADVRAGHLLNDLAVSRSGDVYVTDANRGEIYSILRGTDRLALFFRSDDFMYTNGITMGNDEKTLYVASPGNGVFRVDIPARTCRPVAHAANLTLTAVDGLYFYDRSLIAIQPRFDRVCRFYLDPAGDSVERMDILEAHHPLFNFPTTGAVAGKDFYYIANSQAYSFSSDGTLFPPDKLQEVVILRLDLKPPSSAIRTSSSRRD
jgi:sugar lactone lactonase YvrE